MLVVFLLVFSRILLGQDSSEFTNSIGMKMVRIPSGTFIMGAPDNERQPWPSDPKINITLQHEVTLTTSYYLGALEVSNEQFYRILGNTPGRNPKDESSLPAALMTWESAVKFCDNLSELQEEKAAGRVYRLPTEAEWEFACRSGSKAAYCYGDSPQQLREYAWFSDPIGVAMPRGLQPGGKKKPNAWGLYDMHGNVSEFCHDHFAPYPKGTATDPRGPKDGYTRVVRGGDISSKANECRADYREDFSGASSHNGFRVAMSLIDQIPQSKSVSVVPVSDFDLSSQLDHQPRGGLHLPERRLDYEAMKSSDWLLPALLANGADPNATSDEGTPILFYAIDDAEYEIKDDQSTREAEMAEKRLQKLPTVPRQEWPIPVPKRLVSLLDAGADANRCDQDGLTPLRYAMKNGQGSAIPYLIEYGADPNKPDASGVSDADFAKRRQIHLDLSTPKKQSRPFVPPRTVRIPDAQLGEHKFRPAAGGKAIAYSADGRYLVAAQQERFLSVFDSKTGSRKAVIDTVLNYKANHWIWTIAAIPRTSIVMVSGGIGNPLRLWDIQTATEVMRLDCKCVHASVSHNGAFLFTGDYLCDIQSRDPFTFNPIAREFRGKHGEKIQCRFSFFTPDDRYLIFVDDENIWAWNIANDEVVSLKTDLKWNKRQSITWRDLSKVVKVDENFRLDDVLAFFGPDLNLHSDNSKLLTSNEKFLKRLALKNVYHAFALSPDYRQLAALGSASRIDLFDLNNDGKLLTYDGHTDALQAVATSNDGKLIATGGRDGRAILWVQSTGKMMRTIDLKSKVLSLAFSPDSNFLAIGDADSGVHMHDILGNTTQRWRSSGSITGLRFAPERNSLIVLGDKIQVLDARSGTVKASKPAGSARSGSLAYSPHGLILCSCNYGNLPFRNAWKIQDHSLIDYPEIFGELDPSWIDLATKIVAISVDGRFAATSTRFRGIKLWSLETREPIGRELLGSTSTILDIEFSNDGKYLAASGADGTVRVWDVASSQQLLVCNSDVAYVADIAFQSNGCLVAANSDGTANVWDIAKHLK